MYVTKVDGTKSSIQTVRAPGEFECLCSSSRPLFVGTDGTVRVGGGEYPFCGINVACVRDVGHCVIKS